MARPKEPVARKLKSTALILIAVLLGISAHRLNDQEADIRWRSSHRPTAEVWNAGFASAGFRPVSSLALVGRLSRTLPTLTDSSGRVWKASPDWWAVDTTTSDPPLLYCLRCDPKQPPKTWYPSGTGWEAWESAMQEAKRQAQERAREAKPAVKKGESPDPREIRY